MAETIENNLRSVITDEQPTNPKYYETMSELLDSLIAERRANAIDYAEYLARVIALATQVQTPGGGTRYPSGVDSAARRALYDNLDQNAELALALDSEIRRVKRDSWRDSKIKEREVQYAIREILQDDTRANEIFSVVKSQREY